MLTRQQGSRTTAWLFNLEGARSEITPAQKLQHAAEQRLPGCASLLSARLYALAFFSRSAPGVEFVHEALQAGLRLKRRIGV